MKKILRKLAAAAVTAVFAAVSAVGAFAVNVADYWTDVDLNALYNLSRTVSPSKTYSGNFYEYGETYNYKLAVSSDTTLIFTVSAEVDIWDLDIFTLEGVIQTASKYSASNSKVIVDKNGNLSISRTSSSKAGGVTASYKLKKGTYFARIWCEKPGKGGAVKFSYKKAVTKLSAPANIKVASKTANTIKLSWDKVKGADAYRVFKYDSSKKQYVRYKNVSGTSCTVKDLKADTTYRFRVAALVKSGSSYSLQTASAAFKAKTAAAAAASTKVLSAPATVSYTSSDKGVVLKWDAVSGADAYGVYIFNLETSMYDLMDITETASYTISSLDKDNSYIFSVVALKDKDGSYERQEPAVPFLISTNTKIGNFAPPAAGDPVTSLNRTGICNVSFERIELSPGISDNLYSGNVLYTPLTQNKSVKCYVDIHYNTVGQYNGLTLFVPSDKAMFKSEVDELSVDEKPVQFKDDDGNEGYSWISSDYMVTLTYVEEPNYSYYKLKLIFPKLIK